MNQTNIKQWAYAHRELIFLNQDLLDTLYQGALYINKISFFFPRNSCIIYKEKMKNASDKSFTCIYLSYRYTCRLLGICWKRKTQYIGESFRTEYLVSKILTEGRSSNDQNWTGSSNS